MTPQQAPIIATSRELARAVLDRVERERSFANRALSAALDRARALPPQERALGTELVYGVLRRQARLDRALEAVSDRGLSGLDARVRTVLRVAAYQILFLDRVPAYAAVNEAVEACKKLRSGSRIAGLANALLRRLADRGEPPLPDPARDPFGYLVEGDGFPEWLARLAIDELGSVEAIAFGATVGVPAPLAVRANRLRTDREALLARLAEERAGAEILPSEVAPDGVLVRRIDSPFLTRAFTDGLFAVEDVGAQVVAELCGAAPGERILDACAGLGGKSAHLAALAANEAEIDAADIAPAKLRQARELGRRLGVRGLTTVTADSDEALARSGAALPPRTARCALRGARRAAPPPGGPGAPRARRSGRAGGDAVEDAGDGRAAGDARRALDLFGLYVRSPGMRGGGRGLLAISSHVSNRTTG